MSLFDFAKNKIITKQAAEESTSTLNSDADHSVKSNAVVNNTIKKPQDSFVHDTSTLSIASETLTDSHLKATTVNHNVIAPCPLEIEDTGLSEHLLLGLMLKYLQQLGVMTLRDLASAMCLSGSIIQQLIDIAKAKSWIENYASNANQQMRFSLSSIGALEADKALLKNGYIGPAPVPLSQYTETCLKQTSREQIVTLDELHQIFKNLAFSEELLSKVGPSLNSNKPILIYGEAGAGKSYFCRHLNLVFGGDILVPHAIEVNNEIIQVFDPEIHHQSSNNGKQENVLKLATSFDQRWIVCARPVVVSGGELTASLLEVQFDPNTKIYRAPLQLKANNGIFLMDDLGRQQISPKALFNRWIIPLEERRDFLTLQSGLHFEIPFELLLLFSTNLSPTELVDDAFLRRLGYKIKFEALSKDIYQKIWDQECADNGLDCTSDVFEYLTQELHQQHGRKFLPCYPRDLICIVVDQIKFNKLKQELTKELLNFAWHSYFVK